MKAFSVNRRSLALGAALLLLFVDFVDFFLFYKEVNIFLQY